MLQKHEFWLLNDVELTSFERGLLTGAVMECNYNLLEYCTLLRYFTLFKYLNFLLLKTFALIHLLDNFSY